MFRLEKNHWPLHAFHNIVRDHQMEAVFVSAFVFRRKIVFLGTLFLQTIFCHNKNK